MPDQATIQAISIVITVMLAFIGYIVTYLNNIRLENRNATLKYISDQLQNLYGPLFSLSHASEQAWKSFRSRCRPGGAFFGRNPPPNEQELQQWRLWMAEIFMPMNLRMEKAIIENAHLIEGAEMPEEFLAFLAHIEVYKAVIKKWERGDFSEPTAYENFPEQIRPEVAKTYNALKKRQAELIGSGTT